VIVLVIDYVKVFRYPQSFVDAVEVVFKGDSELILHVQKGSIFYVEKRLKEKGDPKLLKKFRKIMNEREDGKHFVQKERMPPPPKTKLIGFEKLNQRNRVLLELLF
jgi:hypothetical protein